MAGVSLRRGPLDAALLRNVFLNGRSAALIAEASGGRPRLTVRVLRRLSDSYVGPREADQLLARLHREVADRNGADQSIRLRFGYVPISRASQLPDGEALTPGSAERSCFVIARTTDVTEALPAANWNPAVRDAILNLVERAKLCRPETLFALSDADNTGWAGDIGEIVLEAAVGDRPIVSWSKGAPVSPALKRVRRHETPYHYYMELYARNPAAAYNYNADVFAGLTLRQTHEAFLRAAAKGSLPKAYPEMRTLLHLMQDHGIPVGFVSASPLFFVLPMLERAGFKIPVSHVEGVDVYVTDPHHSGEEILLSRFIQSKGFENWDRLLSVYGSRLRITRVAELPSVREGKGAAGRAIVARHVREWTGRHPTAGRPLIESDVRLLAVFGDNFGPFRIHRGDLVQQVGSDHGMLWAAPLLSGAMVFNLVRATDKGAAIDYAAKRSYYDNFEALRAQSTHLGYDLVFLSQIGIASGPRAGQFDPSELPF